MTQGRDDEAEILEDILGEAAFVQCLYSKRVATRAFDPDR
jgi:hypothetical protein